MMETWMKSQMLSQKQSLSPPDMLDREFNHFKYKFQKNENANAAMGSYSIPTDCISHLLLLQNHNVTLQM